jgi:hypothetical protein
VIEAAAGQTDYYCTVYLNRLTIDRAAGAMAAGEEGDLARSRWHDTGEAVGGFARRLGGPVCGRTPGGGSRALERPRSKPRTRRPADLEWNVAADAEQPGVELDRPPPEPGAFRVERHDIVDLADGEQRRGAPVENGAKHLKR